MTDTKTDTKSDSKTTNAPSAQQTTKTSKTGSAAGAAPRRKPSWRMGLVVFVLLLMVAGLAALAWYQHDTLQVQADGLSVQTENASQSAKQAASDAAKAIDVAQGQAGRIDQLQATLADAQQHLQSLEQALQMLTDSGTDLALINDIDHLVSIAHQQLLLGGSVNNAIIALETAQAQLARANRPGLAPLQQAINGDVDRLRAVSTVDVNRLSSRIDELGQLIDKAPLLVPDDAAPTVAADARQPAPQPVQAEQPSTSQADSWWERSAQTLAQWGKDSWQAVRRDIGGFIHIRRVDDEAALLLSPEQAASLRDKLRLRLMTAQLALLMNQPDVWQTETRAIAALLRARYDLDTVDGQRALQLALRLANTSIKVQLPGVENSQQAIQALREEHAKDVAPEPDSSSANEAAPGRNTDANENAAVADPATPDPDAPAGAPASAVSKSSTSGGSAALSAHYPVAITMVLLTGLEG